MRPLPVKCLRYTCSTPQKQPAATVARSVLAGKLSAATPAGSDERAMRDVEVKGRMRRARREDEAKAMRRRRRLGFVGQREELGEGRIGSREEAGEKVADAG